MRDITKDITGARRLAEIDRLEARADGGRRLADCDLVLMALMTVLCLIGLVMVLSASTVQSLHQYGTPWYYFERQALWLALGAVAFFIAVKVDYHRWRRLGVLALIGSLVLLVVVLMPSIGVNGGGSARWIGVGEWRVQPSELAKLALVIFAADVLDRRSEHIRNWRYSMMPVLLAFLAMAALVMLQPDMGTTMILACITLAALYVAGSPLRPLVTLVGAGLGAAFVAAKAAPYRWARLTSFLHPFADASNAGYQSAQSMVALGSGRLFGLGLGATRAATGYLPNQYTDFIYAIIGEETGLLGSLLVVGLFVALAVVGIRVACRARDPFGSILAAGITAWLVGQAVINMGAVVGLLPVTGVPLPFVSYGGSSLIIAMGALGMVCNVARQGLNKQSLKPRTPGASTTPGAGAAAGPGRGRGRRATSGGDVIALAPVAAAGLSRRPPSRAGLGSVRSVRPVRPASASGSASGSGVRSPVGSGGHSGGRVDVSRRAPKVGAPPVGGRRP